MIRWFFSRGLSKNHHIHQYIYIMIIANAPDEASCMVGSIKTAYPSFSREYIGIHVPEGLTFYYSLQMGWRGWTGARGQLLWLRSRIHEKRCLIPRTKQGKLLVDFRAQRSSCPMFLRGKGLLFGNLDLSVSYCSDAFFWLPPYYEPKCLGPKK